MKKTLLPLKINDIIFGKPLKGLFSFINLTVLSAFFLLENVSEIKGQQWQCGQYVTRQIPNGSNYQSQISILFNNNGVVGLNPICTNQDYLFNAAGFYNGYIYAWRQYSGTSQSGGGTSTLCRINNDCTVTPYTTDVPPGNYPPAYTDAAGNYYIADGITTNGVVSIRIYKINLNTLTTTGTNAATVINISAPVTNFFTDATAGIGDMYFDGTDAYFWVNGGPSNGRGNQGLGRIVYTSATTGSYVRITPNIAGNNTNGTRVGGSLFVNAADPGFIYAYGSNVGSAYANQNSVVQDRIFKINTSTGIVTDVVAGGATITQSDGAGCIGSTFEIPAPIAADDQTCRPSGSTVIFDGIGTNAPKVTANDAAFGTSITINQATVRFINPGSFTTNSSDAIGVTSMTVPGQGTWTVNTTNGVVTFVAQSGFGNNPTAILYNVRDSNGKTSNNANISIQYLPLPVFSSCPTPTNLGCNPSGLPAALNITQLGLTGAAFLTSDLSEIVINGCLRTQTRTYTATGSCPQAIAYCAQVFTWRVDTTPPTASNPANITLSGCNGSFPAPDPAVVTNEADNCTDIAPTVTWLSDGTPSLVGCTETIIRTYRVTDACSNTINVTQNLIRNIPAVVVNKPTDSNTSACVYADQAAANTAFATWLNGFTVTGGCSPVGVKSTSTGPNFCGGAVTVNYVVTDKCYTTSTATATFTIIAAPAVVVNKPTDSNTSACVYADQAAANTAFATWLNGFTVTGGCSPVGVKSTSTGPNFCGGAVTVNYVVTDKCYTTSTASATFTITAAPAVVVNKPTDSNTSACVYADQAAANAAFATWLNGFTVTGGCSPVGVKSTSTGPNFCGGAVTVNYVVTDKCYTTSTATATFTITAAPAVVVNKPTDSNTSACVYADQAAANAAFATWLNGFTVTGGCSPVGVKSTSTGPNFCGGAVTVNYVVTDKCYTTSTATATFTITAAPAVVVNKPTDSNTSACVYADQAAANAAFATWLNGFTVTGGCSPVGVKSTSTGPNFCGGAVTVNYVVTDKCYTTSTATATFTITAAPAVVVNKPTDSNTSACVYADQAAANTAFATWLNGFTVTGGCSPVGVKSTSTGPNFCGGAVTVNYVVTDKCYTTSTATATFTIIAAPAVVVNKPTDSNTSACVYADQAAANTAFATWLNGFTVTGGCSPVGVKSTSTGPNFCGGAVTVNYVVTDKCYTTSTATATFTITAAPAVVVNKPTDSNTSACVYADQAAANAAFATWLNGFTVTGGCSPVGVKSTSTGPNFCGGAVTVNYVVTDKCYTTSTATATFTITAAPAVVVNKPTDSNTSACVYADQAAANAAFATWLNGFTVTGGCSPVGVKSTSTGPNFCGGAVTVNYVVTDKCYTTSTATATFTIIAAPAVVVNKPTDSNTSACVYADQAAANTAFATWLNGFTVTGGCSPVGVKSTSTGPNFCGGAVTVNYVVTDKCYTTSTASATFTITAAPAVVVNKPTDSNTSACVYADQAAANAAFATWLNGFTVTGGCSPVGVKSTSTGPNFCGGAVTVNYVVTDKCYTTSTATATFTITAAPAVVVNKPTDSNTSACVYADQAAANAAFATWLNGFTVTGGCSPVGVKSTSTGPNFCGGAVTVNYVVTDKCYTTSTATATFTITAAPAVVVNKPTDSNTSACVYADQAAANAAFATWLNGFTVTGGCSPVGVKSTSTGPNFCGGAVTVNYVVTDKCYTTSTATATFTITAAPAVVVNKPTDSNTSACVYADQAAANTAFATWLNGFTVTGGCSPVGVKSTSTGPNFCGGAVTVNYVVTDKCYTTSTATATFTITAAPAVVVNKPTDSNTSACVYADQAAANAAFATWLNGFTVTGGCSPVGVKSTSTGPNFCGGAVTVNYVVTDKCYTTSTATATFTITAAPAVVVNKPTDSNTSACVYADQAAANTAFATWLNGFTVTGGCSPVGVKSTSTGPNFCGGAVTVNYVVTDKCYTTSTATATFTITTAPAVVVNKPTDSNTSACVYADQAAANAAFATWLNGFTVTGGCSPVGVKSTSTGPNFCGGAVTVNYVVTDKCYTTSTATATFTITAAPAVVVNKPTDSNTSACVYADQAAANAAFATWLNGFTVTGGCSPVGVKSTSTGPNFCGGAVTVNYVVTDKCYTNSTASATFTITAAPAVVVNKPTDSNTSACVYADQAAANAAFATWLNGFTVTGGCSPVGVKSTSTGPNFCGGAVTVNYVVTDKCYTTSTATATFTITAAPAVVVNKPTDSNTSACVYADQAAANAAFATWLNGFTVTGGCSPVGVKSTSTGPNFCGGAVTVNYVVTDKCYTTSTATATFTITAAPAVVVNKPTDSNTSACVYADQAAANAAFATWLNGFTVTGGCSPVGVKSTSTGPNFCGGAVTVNYVVTDKCYTNSTASATFTITADNIKPVITATGTTLNLGDNPTPAMIEAALGSATATDNCSTVVPTFTTTNIVINNCNKSQTRIWNVVDGCGNAAIEVTRTVTWSNPLVTSNTQVNVLCKGALTGSIDLTVSGGSSPYTYIWSNGATTQDISSLAASTYTVTVTDMNNCTKSTSITITEPPAITITNTQTNVLCHGALTGDITLDVSGGVGPYTFDWGLGQPKTQNRSQLAAGTYTVIVKDANMCTKEKTFIITQPPSIVLTTTQQNVVCNGLSTGSINLIVSGGTGAGTYTYNWTKTGQSGVYSTNEDLTGLAAGIYSVTVTDANGCISQVSAEISQPSALLVSETHVNVLCNGLSTGSIQLTVSGGVTPYSINYGSGNTPNLSMAGLPAGLYHVIVTDANNCTKTVDVTIEQPTSIVVTETHTNISCKTGTDASIDITVSGGAAPYSYNWGASQPNTEDRTGITAGTYTVTVTDANNCTKTKTIVITEPQSIVLTSMITDVLCNGASTGSIILTVAGGTSPYSYSWVWTGGTASTKDLTLKKAGVYNVTVTDAKGCTSQLSATILETPVIALTATKLDALCFGTSTGSIDLTVTGGTPGYLYYWNGMLSAQDLTNIPAGSYSILVRDANGCNKSLTLPITISQPTVVSLSITQTNVSCNGFSNGSIDLTPTGGTPGYSYLWSTGATTQDISGLSNGSYTVTVTDANSCTKTLTAIITQPEVIALTLEPVQILCFGSATGSINLTPAGGTAPYTYLWSNGATSKNIGSIGAGTYTVTVTDSKSCTKTGSTIITQQTELLLSAVSTPVLCNGGSTGSIDLTVTGATPNYTYNWSNGKTTQNISGLLAGNYTVTVTDANSCSKTTSVIITQSTPLILTSTQVDVACNGSASGSIDLTVSGSNSPYTYVWSNGLMTQDLTGLSGGTYTVTVTDVNSCTKAQSFTINQNSDISINSTQVNVLCFGLNTGSIDITVTGGFTDSQNPYTYNWGGGIVAEDRINLIAGDYTVIVKDGKGCSTSKIITITQPTLLELTNTKVDVLCYGNSTGSIDLNVIGGTSNYTYKWSNGPTTQDISNLAAGSYTVTVTDANNCSKTTTVSIIQPELLVLSNTTSNVLCNGQSNGSIDLTVNGGVSPFTYVWSSTNTTQDLSNLIAGTYTVTVTDANGCTKETSATITEPPVLALTSTQIDVKCFGAATGKVDLTITGGTLPFSYAWTGWVTTEDLSDLTVGTYSVTVTDGNGCTKSTSVTILEPPVLELTATPTDVKCFGGATGSISLSTEGGTGAYTYLWSNDKTSQNISGLQKGTYTVTVTDANGCTKSTSATVSEPPVLALSTTQIDVKCFGGATGSIDLTTTGGTLPISYAWTGGVTTEDLSDLTIGTYSVTVTDGNGCTKSTSVTILEPPVLVLTATPTDVKCFGGATGSISLSTEGGTGAYTYLWSNDKTSQNISGLLKGTYTVTVTDANGCTKSTSAMVSEPPVLALSTTQIDVKCFGGATGSIDLTTNGGTLPISYAWTGGVTTEDLSDLTVGTYSVTVTDGNGCTKSTSVTILEPPVLVLTATPTDVKCFGGATGSISLSTEGGTGAYTYLWSNDKTSQNISGLLKGTYTVTVTDANGCTKSTSAMVSEPPVLALSTTQIDVKCFGGATGSIDLTTTGGTLPISYAWTGGVTTEDLSDLTVGTYSVTVTDGNGCTKSTSVTILELPVLVLTATPTDVKCFGGATGSISLSTEGGTGAYTYLWSNDKTSQNISGLLKGTYTVTVTDANGCTKSTSAMVSEPPVLALSTTQIDVKCFGGATGSIDLTTTGGTLPISYAWTGGVTTEDLSDLTVGTYSVTVTDGNGCTKSTSVTILEPPVLVLSTTKTDVNCIGNSNGAINLTVSGGTSAYTFAWTGGETTEDLSGLVAGTYTVTVTDANGCTKSTSVTIITTNIGCTAAIGNYVWLDDTKNDVQDASEHGMPGVVVTLKNSSGQNVTADYYGSPISPITTTSDGKYLFDNLAPGSYYINFSLPSGYKRVVANSTNTPSLVAANNDEVDSDANESTGNTDMYLLNAGDRNMTVDAGFQVISGPLPVDLISFSGKQIDEIVNLTWKTANEKNFNHFEIQRSADSKEFGSIGKVTTGNANLYNFQDKSPLGKTNYYRLKMVDNDGSFKLSKIISVDFVKNESFVIVENPAVNGEFMVITDMSKPIFNVKSAIGRNLETNAINVDKNKYLVKMANYVSGTYFLIINSEAKVVTKKVLVP